MTEVNTNLLNKLKKIIIEYKKWLLTAIYRTYIDYELYNDQLGLNNVFRKFIKKILWAKV